MSIRSVLSTLHLFALLLTAVWPDADPESTTGDTGAGLEPNG